MFHLKLDLHFTTADLIPPERKVCLILTGITVTTAIIFTIVVRWEKPIPPLVGNVTFLDKWTSRRKMEYISHCVSCIDLVS